MPVSGSTPLILRRRGWATALVALACVSLAIDPAAGQQPSPAGKADAAARRVGAGNLVGHGGPVKAIRVDAASDRILTGAFDYAAMLWDVSDASPRLLQRLDRHDGAVNAVAFAAGARALAAGDDGVVTLWDVTASQRLHRFGGHEGKVVGLAVSPDGRWAASAGWDRTARLWNIETATAGPVLARHQRPVNAVAFSADGRNLITAGADGMIGLWSLPDGQFVRPLAQLGWGVNVLERIGASDRFLFGALDGSVGSIDLSGEIEPRRGHDRPVLALATLEKPGLIATGGADGIVRVMRADDGAVVEEFKTAFGPVWALAFAPAGTGLYIGGLDDFVTYWRFAPRAGFEAVDATQYPRRFQLSGSFDDPVAKGEIQFARKCSICHTLTPDGANRAGPTLHRLFGRRIATSPGYPFSEPLKKLDIVWTPDWVARLFELGPDVVTPGSKMPLQKMSDKAERDALIAFLAVATIDGAAAQSQNGAEAGDRKP